MKIVSIVSQMKWNTSQKDRLTKLGEFVEYSAKKANSDQVAEMIGDADILIVGSSGVQTVDQNVFEKCKNLKFITVLGVGADFVDLASALKRGIRVSNLRGANSESVAEHIWGLILSLSKKVTESHIGTKAGKYEFLHYFGKELFRKTIGIIGYGEIGSKVARIAKGFDMKILVVTRTHKENQEVEFVTMDRILKESDVIVVTVPLTTETTDLISIDEFGMMKTGVILVSTSREAVINKEALLKTLQDGKLFGFGMELDINMPADPAYYEFSNVVITPHNAFFTKESEDKSNDLAVENVEKFIEGKMQNLVN